MSDKQQVVETEVGRSRNVMVLVLGGFVAVVLLMVVVGFVISVVNVASVRATYGDEIAAACLDMGDDTPDLDNRPATGGASQLLFLRAGTAQQHPWHGQLPSEWAAETGEDVALVGCVFVDDVEIESCDYPRTSPEGDTFTSSIERMQTTATINLVNPVSGARVAELSVTGPEPDPCPPDSEDLNTLQRLEGAEPTVADFEAWLAEFVEG
ncbi:MAG: hypothetical protein AAF125_17760 [Chloroflexota bacterium]